MLLASTLPGISRCGSSRKDWRQLFSILKSYSIGVLFPKSGVESTCRDFISGFYRSTIYMDCQFVSLEPSMQESTTSISPFLLRSESCWNGEGGRQGDKKRESG